MLYFLKYSQRCSVIIFRPHNTICWFTQRKYCFRLYFSSVPFYSRCWNYSNYINPDAIDKTLPLLAKYIWIIAYAYSKTHLYDVWRNAYIFCYDSYIYIYIKSNLKIIYNKSLLVFRYFWESFVSKCMCVFIQTFYFIHLYRTHGPNTQISVWWPWLWNGQSKVLMDIWYCAIELAKISVRDSFFREKHSTVSHACIYGRFMRARIRFFIVFVTLAI